MKKKTLGIIGLGYVGLPLAVQAAEKGYTVKGIDLDEELVDKVNKRISPYVNDDRFRNALEATPSDVLIASQDINDLANAETVVICVPTPTNNNVPDYTYVEETARQIAGILKPGQLISLESTVNPGVTRDMILPILTEATNLQVGKDFFLAHCPERIDPGNDTFYVGNLNRVVGGITDTCTEKATSFYADIIDAEIIPLGSSEEAEFVKSWENSHRNVLIALANSAAVICDGLGMDINNVLAGLQSKIDQFGLKLAKPGIGPGGHCIPEDIHYVIKKARQNGIDTRFLDSAADLNDRMPRYAVSKLEEMMAQDGFKLSDMKVALFGVAYKENIDDMRRSPSVEVAYQLLRHSKDVAIHDPFVPRANLQTIRGAGICDTVEKALQMADAVFIGTAHRDYADEITAAALKQHNIKYVLDGRNCLDRDEIVRLGIRYHGVGR